MNKPKNRLTRLEGALEEISRNQGNLESTLVERDSRILESFEKVAGEAVKQAVSEALHASEDKYQRILSLKEQEIEALKKHLNEEKARNDRIESTLGEMASSSEVVDIVNNAITTNNDLQKASVKSLYRRNLKAARKISKNESQFIVNALDEAHSDIKMDIKNVGDNVVHCMTRLEMLDAQIENLESLGSRYSGLFKAVFSKANQYKNSLKEFNEELAETSDEVRNSVDMVTGASETASTLIEDIQILSNTARDTVGDVIHAREALLDITKQFEISTFDLIAKERRELSANHEVVAKTLRDERDNFSRKVDSTVVNLDGKISRIKQLFEQAQASAEGNAESTEILSRAVSKLQGKMPEISKVELLPAQLKSIMEYLETLADALTLLGGEDQE